MSMRMRWGACASTAAGAARRRREDPLGYAIEKRLHKILPQDFNAQFKNSRIEDGKKMLEKRATDNKKAADMNADASGLSILREVYNYVLNLDELFEKADSCVANDNGFLTSLLSSVLLSLRFFASFSLFKTIKSSPDFAAPLIPKISTGVEGIAWSIFLTLSFMGLKSFFNVELFTNLCHFK